MAAARRSPCTLGWLGQFDKSHKTVNDLRILNEMDLISALLGVSFASGLNVYATVLAMGVLHRVGVLHLPPALDAVASTPILVVAAIMFAVEFVVDKIPYLDSIWDTV